MIYKLMGGALLLLAGGYVSIAISRFEHLRLRVLDGYISLIYYMKGKIDCYAMPVNDILMQADPALIAACLGRTGRGHIVVTEWITVGEMPLTALIRESRVYLAPESERLLTTFSGELGHTYRVEQVARCDYYIQALDEERRRLKDALPARLRVSGVLCLCCAIGAAMLLW